METFQKLWAVFIVALLGIWACTTFQSCASLEALKDKAVRSVSDIDTSTAEAIRSGPETPVEEAPEPVCHVVKKSFWAGGGEEVICEDQTEDYDF